MKREDVKVGGIYRIRQWDDMAREFGTTAGGGAIKCAAAFVNSMRPLCGAEVEILKKRSPGLFNDKLVEVNYLTEVPEKVFSITTDMLEPIEEEVFDVEPASIFDLLGG